MTRSRGAVATAAVVLGVLTISGCGGPPRHNADELPTTTKFQLGAPELKLHVVDRGDLQVEPGTAKTVEVVRYRTGRGGPRTNRVAMENSDLWLDDGCSTASRATCHNRYVVKVPPQLNLVVEVGIGDARVSGITGRVELKADNGDIRVNDTAGNLKITARSGDIALGGLRSQQVEANAERGDTTVSFDAAPTKVDVQADRGEVHLTLPSGAERYRLDVRSGRGEVHSGVPSEASSERSVRVVADLGDIAVQKAA